MDRSETLRLVNWNVAWCPPSSEKGEEVRRILLEHRPDIVCLTEASGRFDLGPGYWLESGADYGYPLRGDRRKVTLFSRTPWSEVDLIGAKDLPPGRFCAGTTATSIGHLRIVGVCIPWSAAHFAGGRRDSRMWQEHIRYLDAFGSIAARCRASTIVVGDFNQTIPRTRAPRTAFEALERAFVPWFSFSSAGLRSDRGPTIDHVALTPDLDCREKGCVFPRRGDGSNLSDHALVFVQISYHCFDTASVLPGS